LPQGYTYEWSGISLEELASGSTTLTLFGLGTLVVYLTLSAQYESFVLPFIILLAVPMALLGALSAQWIRGQQNDVFCQVGLVMLVGLASKNAILIVEFAEQLRERGLTILDAAVEAARIRLRPILMTSFAFILGVVPLVTASGDAKRNQPRSRRGGCPHLPSRAQLGICRRSKIKHLAEALSFLHASCIARSLTPSNRRHRPRSAVLDLRRLR